ncbi:MAG: hypothetical protein P8N09_08405 [Planctomycetota bacterium]|jgi:hypothetical protein|nr:hypothetical protein [Planctomycetota bacterium]
MNARNAMDTVGDWARAATAFGCSLVGLFLIIQVLYPESTINVIAGIGGVVSQFSGLNGLITLLILVALVVPSSRSA